MDNIPLRREIFLIHTVIKVGFQVVWAKVQFKSLQARGLIKDGECIFKTFPNYSLLSET